MSGEGSDATATDRRTVLRTAAAGLAAVPGTVGAADADQGALVLGYHDVDANLVGRTAVTYRSAAAAGSVCDLEEAYRHPVVAPPTRAGEDGVYVDLYAARQFERGTVLEVVDQIQGCTHEGTELIGVFVDAVATPPDEDESTTTADEGSDGDG